MKSCLLVLLFGVAAHGSALQFVAVDELVEVEEGWIDGDLAIEIPEGTILPVQLSLEGDLVDLTGESEYQLRVKERLFVRYSDDRLLFSRDGMEWGDFTDLCGGEISLALGRGDAGLFLGIECKSYARSTLSP